MAGRVETGSDDGGKHERIPPVPVGERVKVGDVDIDGFAGLDVGHLLFENVRPPLNQEARPVALCPRLAVDGLSFFLFAQDAANGSLSDDHQELGHRGFFRQRKEVDGLDPGVERVGELLLDLDRADMTGDGGIHGGMLQR